jgi:hypothetical protein
MLFLPCVTGRIFQSDGTVAGTAVGKIFGAKRVDFNFTGKRPNYADNPICFHDAHCEECKGLYEQARIPDA